MTDANNQIRTTPSAFRRNFSGGAVCPRDLRFLEMLNGYRATGGLARDAEIVDRFRQKGLNPARCNPQHICFDWGPSLWWPRFQFEWKTMFIRQGAVDVISELSVMLDGWGRSLWFVLPNVWIGNAKPIDLFEDRFGEVIGAARALRFNGANWESPFQSAKR